MLRRGGAGRREQKQSKSRTETNHSKVFKSDIEQDLKYCVTQNNPTTKLTFITNFVTKDPQSQDRISTKDGLESLVKIVSISNQRLDQDIIPTKSGLESLVKRVSISLGFAASSSTTGPDEGLSWTLLLLLLIFWQSVN